MAFQLYSYFWTEGFDSERSLVIAARDLEHADALLAATQWTTEYGVWRVVEGCTSETAGVKYDSWLERNKQ